MDHLPIGSDIVIVVAVVTMVFALSSCVAGWADRRWPLGALVALAAALGLLAHVHVVLRAEGLTFRAIPEAFIHVVAKLL